MKRGRWEAVRELGTGGQGIVHFAIDTDKVNMDAIATRIREAVPVINAAGTPEVRHRSALELLWAVEQYLRREDPDNSGALKVLHPHILKDEKGRQRLETEVGLLSRLDHPSVIRVIDARPDEGWFVTPFYRDGPLASRLERFKGKSVAALEAFRSLVEGVAILHDAGVVHRDIKPENIFVSEGRLVLGDFGIAYVDDGGTSRVSDKYENVGSRDWMPGWAMGMRLEDVRPTFDLFSLGKVLWALVSGRTKMRLWYWKDDEFNLEQLFPDDDSMLWINRLLAGLVVERERDLGWPAAFELLQQVDAVLSILKRSGQVMQRHNLRRCMVCGRGPYEEIVGEDSPYAALENLGLAYKAARFRIYRCRSCGHLQFFKMDERPPAWGEV